MSNGQEMSLGLFSEKSKMPSTFLHSNKTEVKQQPTESSMAKSKVTRLGEL
jgi:hypothetical protein